MSIPSIKDKFSELSSLGKRAFIPYIMAGDPSLEDTLKRMQLLQDCGADIIELGVPFSDPLADGPTIQAAAARALSKGISLRKILSFVKGIRGQISVPIVLMTYYNPVFKYGEDIFLKDALEAGIGGLIIPDLTAEESLVFVDKARRLNIDTIFLIAPTSTEDRIVKISSLCSGFIYYVSITGITGAKLELPEDFYSQLRLIRASSDLPIAVGFGISSPEEAANLSKHVNGVIIGSAIVKSFYQDPPKSTENYLHNLREAIGN